MKRHPFIAGALCGAVIAAVVHALWFRPFFHHHPPPPEMMEQMLVHRFTDDLGLSRDQVAAVTPILSRLHLKMLQAKSAERNITDPAFDEAAAEIDKLLEPEQRGRLQDLKERMLDSRAKEDEYLKHRLEALHPSPSPQP